MSEESNAGSLLRRFWPVLALLVSQAVIALDLDLPLVRPVLALVTVLGLPTLVLFSRGGFPGENATTRLLYAFGASLLGAIVVGLLLNETLPLIGIDHPLQPAALAIAYLVVDVGLLAWRRDVALLPPLDRRDLWRRAVEARLEVAQVIAVAALVLAVLGAVRLNNGAGGALALASEVLVAALLVVLMLKPEGPLGRDARCLWLAAASLLLATSLRGWYITGHDIQAEFLSFRLTNDAQHWQMSSLQNAYNACLSVNILPTVLSQTTGLSGVVVFKVLLQLVFALVPVLTYLFSRRFLSRRLALVAATFTMAFPTFYTDMPYLVRQEIAFFFLALMLLAATEPGRRPFPLRALVVVFGVGVVLSHYSTTYVMLTGLALGLVALAVLSVVRRLRGPEGTGSPLVLLNPVVVALLVAATLAWAGPVTHTGGHASDVARQTLAVITGKGDSGPGSSDTSYRLFSHDDTTPRQRMDLFVKATMTYRKTLPQQDLLIKHPSAAELHPEIAPAAKAPLTVAGRALDSHGIDPTVVGNAAKFGCALVMQLFILLGLLWLVRRRKRPEVNGRETPEDLPDPSREVVAVSLGAAAALALIVLVPNLSVDYGVLRAFQQTMLVLAPAMAAGMWMLFRSLRPLASRAVVLSVVVPVALLLVLTGVLPAALGGNQPRIALSNSGSYYDRFYANDAEMQAISRLTAADEAQGDRSKIIANRNVAVRLLAETKNTAPVADRLYPTLLTKGDYVFLDPQIAKKGQSTIFYTGDLLTYEYPVQDLDRRLDLVYSSPSSRIYR